MSLFDSLFSPFESFTSCPSSTDVEALDATNTINPANGSPMIGVVDIQGNPYGCDTSSTSTIHWD